MTDTRVTIFADAGNAGRQAAATLSDRLNVAGVPNRVVWPIHGDDFNDDLQRGATAADYERAASAEAGDAAGEPYIDASAAPASGIIGRVDQLLAEAEALTNPPDLAALGTLLGRVVHERLEPLPERQVLARIKAATGIAVAILEKQLGELRRRLNTTGSVHGTVLRPRWAGRLRLDLSGTPERNDDAELDRKKVAAMHALFITTPAPSEPFDPAETDGETGDRTLDLEPGQVVMLEPGEEIQTSAPADSGGTYEPFQYRTLLQVSAALGIPYAYLSNDMVRANYSNSRLALLELRWSVTRNSLQRSLFRGAGRVRSD